MALQPQRTLGELRAELRVRLGFAAAGAAGGPNDLTLDSFLRTAQDYLYWRYELPRLRTHWDVTVGQDQNLVDYPDECEPRRIERIEVQVSGWWQALAGGIEPWHESTMDNQGIPQRFELRDQIRLWPKADQTYTLRIRGIRRLGRFTQDGDRATVDDALVLAVALRDAKLHYRQPDAQVYADEAAGLLASLAAGAHRGMRYVPGGSRPEVIPRPKLIT